MTILKPPRSRTALRRTVDTLWSAALGGSPFAFWYFVAHPTFLPGWVQIGFPTTVIGLVALAKAAMTHPPQLSWDRDGLTWCRGAEVTQIPWSDYKGYRLSWDVPRRVKLLRHAEGPVVIELFEFDEDQRAQLLAELAVHTKSALPV